MLKLNLSDLEGSQIKYKISNMPDGQRDIVIDNVVEEGSENFYNMTILANAGINKRGVEIQSHFSTFRDLELILCATASLRRLGVKSISLYIPYLLGARSDRQFVEGGDSYLVDVVAPVINSQNFERVTVLDVHSDVAPACIKNIKLIDNIELANFAAADTDKLINEAVFVSPDAGALKKVYKVAETLKVPGVAIGNKHRDVLTGKILSTGVMLPSYTAEDLARDYYIFDDICDGGRTFTELAKSLREAGVTGKLYLVVTHGIFSAGFDKLLDCFDKIYTTNSYKNVNVKPVNVEDGDLITTDYSERILVQKVI